MRNKLLYILFTCYLPVFASAQSSSGINAAIRSYGAATYKNINSGKFLKNWLVAGPVKLEHDSANSPAEDLQQQFFEKDHITFTAAKGTALPQPVRTGKALSWKNFSSTSDQVHFDSIFGTVDFAAAYAVAEIVSDQEVSALLGIGSDDAVKVFLNGKLVHKNWIARGITADDDVVPVKLVKGKNQLAIEVQDIQGGWGFVARFLDKAALADKLANAARSGNLDQIKMLLSQGADVNAKGKSGLTALQAAKISGRKAIEKMLIDSGAKATPVPAPATLIDALYSDLNNEPRPGIALLVAKDGKVVYSKGFGYADIAKKKKITPATRFRIGSITKQFAASAILKLQEEGKVNVTDKLSKYIPDFPRGDEVTLHHLLTHTSGIHSFTNTDSFLNKVVKKITPDEMVAYIKTLPYDFNPGERYEYNNSGYFLAGYIVEKVSGKSFNDFLQQKFFVPIGMTSTGIYVNDAKPENEARGYNKTTKYDTALNWEMSWAGGAGALYSTVEDLHKWNEALFGGKVLSKESMKAAFTPVLLNSGKTPPGMDYGYGWGINKFRGTSMVGHSGGLHGFVSQLARYNDHQLTVTMLTNQTPVEVELDPSKIAEMFLWEKLDSQVSYEIKDVKIADAKIYEGRYDLGSGMVMTVTAEGTSLYAQVAGQGKYEIFPMGEDEFFWKVVEAKVKFIKNDKGEVTSAKFEQGGFKVTTDKMKEETYITVDEKVLKGYEGRFQYMPEVVIEVTSANGKLYAHPTGDQKYELKALTTELFLIREINARLLFIKGAGGVVEKVNVDFRGTKKDAMRIK